jgi:hypothetical protein
VADSFHTGAKLPAAVPATPEVDAAYTWTARVRGVGAGRATAYARSQAFTIQDQASFREADPHASAIEYLLGAVGGDLVIGFAALAARRGILVEALEASVSGQLDNPLVLLGVVGETGHSGLAAVSATLYVSAAADPSALRAVWHDTLARSPLVTTLRRCVVFSLDMQITP